MRQLQAGKRVIHSSNSAFEVFAVKEVLTPRQKEEISKMAADPLATYQRVERALEKWRGLKAHCVKYNERFKANLDAEQHATVGRLDPYLLSAMLSDSDFVDKTYVQDLLRIDPTCMN